MHFLASGIASAAAHLSNCCGIQVQLLNENNVTFGTFDILSDEDVCIHSVYHGCLILGLWQVRQGLKAFSNWPTYPQLYSNGELLGGLDILKVHELE